MDISYGSFFFLGGVIALLPVDFGKEIWNFILQITGRLVLKNDNYVVVRMDCREEDPI